MTKDQQWKTVVEGLAVACVALDAENLPGSKLSVDFAFKHAWREWSWASKYPSIDPDSAYVYFSKSERRNGAYGAFAWERLLGPYLVRAFGGWDPDEVLDLVSKSSGVPTDGWRALAQSFMVDLRGKTEGI